MSHLSRTHLIILILTTISLFSCNPNLPESSESNSNESKAATISPIQWKIHTASPNAKPSPTYSYPTLSEVFKAIRQFRSSTSHISPDTTGLKTFAGFDFDEFEPVAGKRDKGDYFKIALDTLGHPKMIHHIDPAGVSNFSIAVAQFPAFTLMRISYYPFQFGQLGFERPGSTFLYLPQAKARLFFDTMDFVHQAADSLKYLNSITFVDHDLIPRRRMVLEEGVVKYFLKAQYWDKVQLKGEEIYLWPSSACETNYPRQLTETTRIDKIAQLWAEDWDHCLEKVGRLSPLEDFNRPWWTSPARIRFK